MTKNEAGLILLALKAKNLKALKILLENERLQNLIEIMQGPKFDQNGNQVVRTWDYTYLFAGDGQEKAVKLPFENIGFAILADVDHSADKINQQMLVHLLK